MPVDPGTGQYASVADPTTWTSYGLALDRYRDDAELDVLGYVFTESGPYLGIDLDDCRDPDSGELDGWAGLVVNELDSYTDVSPSGSGLHVLLEGDVPEGGNRNGAVEMYDHKRFFTMTGQHLDGTPQ